MSYVGLGQGVWVECIFSLLAVLVCVLSVNYWGLLYSLVAPIAGTGPQIDYMAFLLFFLMLLLLSRLLGRKVLSLFKIRQHDWFVHGFGLIVGAVRGLWWAGFFLLILLSSSWTYGHKSIEGSLFGTKLAAASEQLVGLVSRDLGAAESEGALIPSAKR